MSAAVVNVHMTLTLRNQHGTMEKRRTRSLILLKCARSNTPWTSFCAQVPARALIKRAYMGAALQFCTCNRPPVLEPGDCNVQCRRLYHPSLAVVYCTVSMSIIWELRIGDSLGIVRDTCYGLTTFSTYA